MTETLANISVISYIGFGVFFLLTIVLFFALHIPTVIGDLSGRNAKKSIEKMRKKNEKENKIQFNTNNPILFETDVLEENQVNVHKDEAVSLLWEKSTELLTEEDNETTILNEQVKMQNRSSNSGIELSMIEEEILVHTNEVIV